MIPLSMPTFHSFVPIINRFACRFPGEVAVYINSEFALILDRIRFGEFLCCQEFADARNCDCSI
jgi:hypothetical protein